MKRIAKVRKQRILRARSALMCAEQIESITILSSDVTIQNMCEMVCQQTARSGRVIAEE